MKKLAYQEVMEWAAEELQNGNRIKAARIQRAAEKMKARYEADQEKWQSAYFY